MAAPAAAKDRRGIISEFMVSDVFIVVVSQTNAYAHAQYRVRERRFYATLENGLWVYRDRLRWRAWLES